MAQAQATIAVQVAPGFGRAGFERALSNARAVGLDATIETRIQWREECGRRLAVAGASLEAVADVMAAMGDRGAREGAPLRDMLPTIREIASHLR